MTNEELVESYQDGNRGALDELIKNNKGIVYKLARNLLHNFKVSGTNSIELEDLVQEGYVGLMSAAEKYDLECDNKASFISYAYTCILHQILRMVTIKDTSGETSLNAPAYTNDDTGNSSEVIDYIEGANYDYENVEEQIFIDEIRSNLNVCMDEYLSVKQRQILRLSYGIGEVPPMIDKDIGELFGVSGSNVQAIRKYSLRRLKDSKWGATDGIKLYEQL